MQEYRAKLVGIHDFRASFLAYADDVVPTASATGPPQEHSVRMVRWAHA
jgi:hypothetical protein